MRVIDDYSSGITKSLSVSGRSGGLGETDTPGVLGTVSI